MPFLLPFIIFLKTGLPPCRASSRASVRHTSARGRGGAVLGCSQMRCLWRAQTRCNSAPDVHHVCNAGYCATYISPIAQHLTMFPLPQIKQPKRLLHVRAADAWDGGGTSAAGHAWLLTRVFARVHPATARRRGRPAQPQAQAPSQQEHVSLGGQTEQTQPRRCPPTAPTPSQRDRERTARGKETRSERKSEGEEMGPAKTP